MTDQTYTLNNGQKIPALGLGMFFSCSTSLLLWSSRWDTPLSSPRPPPPLPLSLVLLEWAGRIES